jgi:hypothetical protein
MMFTVKGVPLTLRPAFQEYVLEDLDPTEHDFSIIERTLAYGQREELRWLFRQYGATKLADWVREAGWRLLPQRRLSFWTTYFDLSELPQRGGVWQH